MRYFSSNGITSWSTKVNFVDENNVLVGYDFSGLCCEQYGWYIHNKVTSNMEDSLFDENTDINAINGSLKEWTFDPTFFDETHGSDRYNVECRAVFRLVYGDNELFLHLYNVHNGYYSHGFEFSKDGVVLNQGDL
jgi:hypothetical protein